MRFLLASLLLFLSSVQAQQLDCSAFDENVYQVNENVGLQQIINPDEGTVTVQLTYEGQGWLGFACSETPQMVPDPPNVAVIGLPDEGTVRKYTLGGKSDNLVTVLDDSLQTTLTDASITQNNTHTVLRFTKPLVEDGEVAVTPGENTFIWAYGSSNTPLTYHGTGRGGDSTTFTQCLQQGETAAPTPAPAEPGSGPIDLGNGLLLNTLNFDNVELVFLSDENAGTLQVNMTYEGEGWIAFAFSGDGKMVGSDAVIALPDDGTGVPQKHSMSSQSDAGVTPLPANQQTLTDASYTQEGGRTFMTFTRKFEEPGEVPVTLEGSNNFLYAYGSNNGLGYHAVREPFTLDLASGAAGSGGNKTQNLWKVHGACMAAAWAILVPLAVGSSILRGILPFPEGVWFQIHRALNSLGLLLTIVAFAIAVYNIQDSGGDHFKVVKHRTIGLVIFIFAVFQAASGFFRPHLPHKPDPNDQKDQADVEDASEKEEPDDSAPKKSLIRVLWEYQHKILGTATLIMAWYNCDSGIDRYNTLYQGKSLVGALWGVIAGIVFLTLIGRIYQVFRK